MNRGFAYFFVAAALVALVIVLRPGILCDAFGLGCSDSRARACLQATGSQTEASPSFSQSGNSFTLGGREVITGSQDPEVLDRIFACMRQAQATGIRPEDDFFVNVPVPLGLVEQQWQGGTLALDLREPTEPVARDQLNNLAFGPAGGQRSELIEQFCQDNAACVSCNTASGGGAVTISLAATHAVSAFYEGTAPLAGNRAEPWQLVERPEGETDLPEGVGRRVLFQCER